MKPFITTYTGKKINPLDLHIDDINILDIAHHLACLNRFVGALKRPVSIGQHSVYVARLLHGTKWEKEGLFHDAPEYVLGDVSKWVKAAPEFKFYREAEDRAWDVICQALHLDVVGTPENIIVIREADDLMVRYENLRQGSRPLHMFELPSHPEPTIEEIEKIGRWAPWSWQQSERGFLDHARMLGYPV